MRRFPQTDLSELKVKLALGHGNLSSLTSEVAHQSTLPARAQPSRVYNIHSI